MLTVSDFYKQNFGQKVYKISLDAGCTCPTRDGTKGTGGCIFCSQSGSGDFVADRALGITEQIEKAKLLVNNKFSRAARRGQQVQKKYIAYFQNYTNTYGNAEELLKKYREALNAKDIVGLAIATRPDCLNAQILNGIAEIAEKNYVQIELGLQTINEKTAEYCRRGFKNSVYEQAVKQLKNCGVHVVTHLIFGLPGDSKENMLDSVKYVCRICQENLKDYFGIKITSLYVLEQTDLAADYRAKKFNTLEEDEYLELVSKAVKLIPENCVVHRLTGDPPKKLLIAPEWTANKREVMNRIRALKL